MPTLKIVEPVAPSPEGADPVLELDLIGLSYGAAPVLGPISLSLQPGETLALTGPSGVGKSSLLRAIAGLETGWSGTCSHPGRMAMVFQEPMLLPWRSVLRNLTLTTGCSPEKAREILAEVGLAGAEGTFPGRLSLGQQRRVSLARAFATEPDLLLMDEPFVSLDAKTADDMMSLFARLRNSRRTATILVTHAMAEAERLANRIVTLGGRPATITSDRANRPGLFTAT